MATKQISRQISMNSDKKNCLHIYHVEKCLHMTDFTSHFSTWHDFSLYLPCGDISPTEHLSCRDTSPHDNLSHGKISPHDRFFLHQHRWWCWWQISGMLFDKDKFQKVVKCISVAIAVTQHVNIWLFTLSILVTLIQLGHPQIMRERGIKVESLFHQRNCFYCTQTNLNFKNIFRLFC